MGDHPTAAESEQVVRQWAEDERHNTTLACHVLDVLNVLDNERAKVPAAGDPTREQIASVVWQGVGRLVADVQDECVEVDDRVALHRSEQLTSDLVALLASSPSCPYVSSTDEGTSHCTLSAATTKAAFDKLTDTEAELFHAREVIRRLMDGQEITETVRGLEWWGGGPPANDTPCPVTDDQRTALRAAQGLEVRPVEIGVADVQEAHRQALVANRIEPVHIDTPDDGEVDGPVICQAYGQASPMYVCLREAEGEWRSPAEGRSLALAEIERLRAVEQAAREWALARSSAIVVWENGGDGPAADAVEEAWAGRLSDLVTPSEATDA